MSNMNRRAFLRVSALTTAGLYVAPDLLAEPRRRIFPVGIDLGPRVVGAESIHIAVRQTPEWSSSCRLPVAIRYGETDITVALPDGTRRVFRDVRDPVIEHGFRDGHELTQVTFEDAGGQRWRLQRSEPLWQPSARIGAGNGP